MKLTNSIHLPGLTHYRASRNPDGTIWFNTKDGHTYMTQRGVWVCITGDEGVMPMISRKSRLSRVLHRIKSIFF